ncbi:MAG: DUF480 domain-containing protein [Solirubrobacterales bacterium]
MSLAPTDLDPVELRILGCLIAKQRTTPDTCPLTLNALRAGTAAVLLARLDQT